MNLVLKPWQLLLLILAGWINRDQQDAIEYLLTENQVLRVVMHLKTRRIEIAGATPHPNSAWMQQSRKEPDRLYRRLFPQLNPRHA